MAKKDQKKKKKKKVTQRARARTPRASPSIAAAENPPPVIEVPDGGRLQVIVDVGPMVTPYTVAYDGGTVIKSLVDEAEMVPLKPGSHLLGWQFSHAGEGWHHTLAYSISSGPVKVLEEKSKANGDIADSNGIALVRS